MRRGLAVAFAVSAGLGAPAWTGPEASLAQETDEASPALGVWADEVSKPRLVASVEPRLTQDLASRGFGDDLVVECTVDEDGGVAVAKVLNGAPELRAVVEAAALQWRYRPTRKRGRPVRVRLHESVSLWPPERRTEKWPGIGSPEEGEEWTVWPEGPGAGLRLVEYTVGRRQVGEAHRYLVGKVENVAHRTLLDVHAVGFHRNSLAASPEHVLVRLGDIAAGETRDFVIELAGLHGWVQFAEIREGETYAISTRRQRSTLVRVPHLFDGPARPADSAPPPPTTESPYSAPPRVKEMTQPIFPRRAFDSKTEGTVVLEIWIDEEGYVDRVRPIAALPGTGLDAAAIRTVLEWRFEPARKDGVPVATTARAPVTFRIY